MPNLRINNGIDRLSDADLEVKANSIVSDMTGNADFPTPTPALAAVQTAIDAYTQALATAQSGSNYDKAVKNQKRSDLIDLLHSLSNYVLFTANGDELIAKSSGFSIARQSNPLPPITKAENLQLEDGANSGELVFTFDRVAGARSYVYQYAQDPVVNESAWQIQTGTSRKAVFSGLESQKKYLCRVIVIGSNGQQVTSDAVSRVVQ